MLDKIIKARRSVRKFKSIKPDWRDILECIDSMRYAPMAGNNFSLKFIVVDDEEKIDKLAEASQQRFISQANYIVVVCSITSRTETSYGERGKTYLRQQAGAAIQNFLLKLTEKGLATCWIGHFVDNQVRRILKIPEDVNVEALFPIGYAFKKPEPKRKIDLTSVLYFNEYKQKKMHPPEKIDV